MSRSRYWLAHRALEASRGRASTHTCSCGEPAKDWAYQHTAGDNELTEEDGSVFSLNPEDYRPMCRRCHAALDQTGAKIGPKASATLQAKLQSDPAFRELKAGIARGVAVARVRRAEADPAFRERLRAGSLRGARTMASVRRKCGGCDMVSHPVGIGRHQKASGHEGWVVVP